MKYSTSFLSLIPILVLLALFSGPGPAAAAAPGPENHLLSNYDFQKASDLFESGLKNTLLGWTLIFAEPYQSVRYEAQDPFTGTAEGLIQALSCTVTGVWDLATFWIPGQTHNPWPGKADVMKELRSVSSAEEV